MTEYFYVPFKFVVTAVPIGMHFGDVFGRCVMNVLPLVLVDFRGVIRHGVQK